MRSPLFASRFAALAVALGCLLPAGVSAQEGPVLVGRVVSDSADRPIAGATLGLPGLGQIVQSDSLGRFIFPRRLPSRLILIRVQAFGFEAVETTLTLEAPDTAEVEFVLPRSAQVLGGVRVSAPRVDRRLREFDRRMRTESGVFFNDSIISRYSRAGRVSTLIGSRTQLRVVGAPTGVGTEQYVTGARGSELTIGGARPCYSGVILDGTWVYSGQSGEPRFNINSIASETIAAMEVYRSTADIPVEFRRIGNYCGLVVLWLK